VVLYEAGNRTGATLEDLAGALGDRPAAVARELTKLHEEIVRGTLAELARRFSGEVLGEVTVVVAGAPEGAGADEAAAEPLEAELARRLAAGEAPSALAREVARARGLRRADVYEAIQRLKGQ
jgi:16S rRNA (cytidine1402-2'-O)-methyltransferase